MTKLSDTQLLILSNAAQRDDRNVLPLPGSLRGAARKKVIDALLSRGLIVESQTDSTMKADDAMNRIWRNDDDDRAWVLHITDAGLEAIGVEPEGAPERATGAPSQDAATTDADGDEGAPDAPTAPDTAKTPRTRAGTKQARLIEMLRAPEGATIAEITEATGWQPHTVRGAIAGALKKKLGLDVTSEKDDQRGRVYRLPPA